jgi:protein-S-isoprenylcysteine O-methyltransferase Ste14
MNAYVAISYICWGFIAVIWFSYSFKNKKTVQRPEKNTFLFSSFLLFVCDFLILSNYLPFIDNHLITPRSFEFGIVGALLAVFGTVWAIWSRFSLGKNWSATMATVKEDHKLIQEGPYKITRHPIYTGLLFLILGSALTMGYISSYLAFIFGLIAFLMRINIEERIMIAQFGDIYVDYKKKVKTLIPFIW